MGATLAGLAHLRIDSAAGTAAIDVAGTSVLFAGALFAVTRLNRCNVCESALSSERALCQSGFAKIVNNAMTTANETTFAIRPTSVIFESPSVVVVAPERVPAVTQAQPFFACPHLRLRGEGAVGAGVT